MLPWQKKKEDKKEQDRKFRNFHLNADDRLVINTLEESVEVARLNEMTAKLYKLMGVEHEPIEKGVVPVSIEKGDVVWLKSACKSCEADFKSGVDIVAPKSTVYEIDGDVAKTIRWDGRTYIREEFPVVALTVVYKDADFKK